MQDRTSTDTECGIGLYASAGHRWEPQSLHSEGNPIAHKIATIALTRPDSISRETRGTVGSGELWSKP